MHTRLRSGFSLIELLLALALTAMVTVLLGQLMQNYIAQSEGPVERMIQDQEARKILTLITDDLRGVVRNQTFDAAALQQILGSAKGGSAQSGGGASGGGGATTGLTSSTMSTGSGLTTGPSGSSADGGATGGSTGTSGTSGGAASGATGTTTGSTGSYPPGVYGTSTALELDISRIPRPDQYFVQQVSVIDGKLADIPSDTKTVSYFVQAPTTMGVQDPLSTSVNGTGGLVRRQIDRAISKWANEQGQGQMLDRTGELLSTAVVSIEFSYYNGVEWSYSWDSSVEGLPWMIEIVIAMQDPIIAKTNPVVAGLDLSTMDSATLSEFGIRTYNARVAIPGAPLLSVPQATQSSSGDNGMGAMGL